MAANLNHCSRTMGVFNNCNILICNFCNIWYCKLFRNCSTFIFLMQYPYVQLIYLHSKSLLTFIFKFIDSNVLPNSHMLQSNFLIQDITTICQSFWLYEIVLKLSSDIKQNAGPKPTINFIIF